MPHEALAKLTRPLPESMAALYRLRLPSTGGLRLTVLVNGGQGRMSVNEPFGALVSVSAWAPGVSPSVYDIRRGCQVSQADIGGLLGVASLPLAQAARLLGGRLPALEGDVIGNDDAGGVSIRGAGWAGRVFLEVEPWRVVAVEDDFVPGEPRWRVELSDHTSTVPGFVRFEHIESGWAELELASLEWDGVAELPKLPELPPCGVDQGS